MSFEVRFLSGVDEVDAAAWDRLVGAGSPFHEHAFLAACEAASALPRFGYLAQHVTVWQGETLRAALPLYVKGDGRAEFIYDWQWAMLARRLGIPYYPKMVSMAPFSPVPGEHLLLDGSFASDNLLEKLVELVEDGARRAGMQGVHYLFVPEEEAERIARLGYLRRLTWQLVWENRGYADFDAFLARFRSKDRVKIKRELRRVPEAGLRLEVRSGDQLESADLDAMYDFYSRTCLLYGTGSHYLQRGTWEELFARWRHRLVLFLAFAGDERVGGSLCVRKGSALYGRYWGAREDVPALYFNATCYAPIRYAIEHGLAKFYAGFGNAPYKQARGLDPEPTHSVHRVFDGRLMGILRAVLAQERAHKQAEIDELLRCSKLKRNRGSAG